jgi:hypothetical protein
LQNSAAFCLTAVNAEAVIADKLLLKLKKLQLADLLLADLLLRVKLNLPKHYLFS